MEKNKNLKFELIKIRTGKVATPTLSVYRGGNAVMNKECVSSYNFKHGQRFNAAIADKQLYLIPTLDKEYSQKLNVGLNGTGLLSNREWNSQAGINPNTKYKVDQVSNGGLFYYKLTILP